MYLNAAIPLMHLAGNLQSMGAQAALLVHHVSGV